MPQRSSITRLPKAVQDKLHGCYKAGLTLDEIYDALCHYLHEVDGEWEVPSRSAIHRNRQSFEKIAERKRESREIAQAIGQEMDELGQDKTGNVIVDMLRELIFRQLRKGVEDDEQFDPKVFMQLGKAIKDAASASAITNKEKADIRAEARKEAAEAVEKEAKKRGFDKETIRAFFDIASGKAG
jgi:hypothetical protein